MTVRNVPDDVREELAARAARSGQSLQEHLRAALIDLAARPSARDLMVQVRARKAATGSRLTAEAILEHGEADRA